MTLISTIITDAYREPNLIAAGTTETATETAEGLSRLNRYIRSLMGSEVGDPLIDMPYGNNANIENVYRQTDFERAIEQWHVPKNYRLKLNLSEAKTLRLPPNPEDGARLGVVDASNNLSTYNLTLDGNGSRIENGLEVVLNTDGYSAEWFYRTDTANWARVTDLVTSDQSPFPDEFDDLLIIGLANRLDPLNGASLSVASQQRYFEVMKKFRARYSQIQEKAVDEALCHITGRRMYTRGYSLDGEFEKGSIIRW